VLRLLSFSNLVTLILFLSSTALARKEKLPLACPFHLLALAEAGYIKHPQEAKKSKVLTLLKQRLAEQEAFVKAELGTVTSYRHLGDGENGIVFRLIGSNGRSLIVKMRKSSAKNDPEKERQMRSHLNDILAGDETVHMPLANGPTADANIEFYPDLTGITLQEFLKSSSFPQEWKNELSQRFEDYLKDLRKRATAWGPAHGYEVDYWRSALEYLTLRKDGVDLTYWFHRDNILVRPDGSFKIIDPF
jgi:hypothetical protein